jgi:hypothetical protein
MRMASPHTLRDEETHIHEFKGRAKGSKDNARMSVACVLYIVQMTEEMCFDEAKTYCQSISPPAISSPRSSYHNA